MKRQGITYSELSWRSGLLVSSLKAWRGSKDGPRPNVPSLASLEAALGALGWGIAPYPKLETLPPEVLAKIEQIGEHFISDESVIATAMAAISRPGDRCVNGKPAPRIEYRKPTWEYAE